MTYGSLRKRPAASALRAKVRARIESLENRALMSAGDLDGNWGNNGLVFTDLGGESGSRGELAMAVAIQEDGKIVTAGQTADSNTGQTVFGLSRHHANGDLDTSFGDGGTVITEIADGAQSLAQAVAIDGQGRIIVAGRTGIGAGDALTVARYTSNGDLDSTFQGEGFATYEFIAPRVADVSLAIDESNQVYIGYTNFGTQTSDMAVTRLNDSGFIDGSFGNGGRAVTDVANGDRAGAIAIDADGSIVQAGTALSLGGGSAVNGQLIVARFSSSGARDTAGYGNGTGVFVDTTVPLDVVNSVMIDVNGSLLVAGSAMGTSETSGSYTGLFNLIRVAADGSAISDISAGSLENDSLSWSMTMQPDGKILVAGDNFSLNTFEQKYVIARFNGQLNRDSSFGDGDGTEDGMYVSPIDPSPATSVVVDSQNQILIVGNAFGANDFDFLMARHDTSMVGGPPLVIADANAREDDEPYEVNELSTITLEGFGSVAASGGGVTFNQSQRRATAGVGSGGDVTYAWDLDGDFEFDDSTEQNPVFNGAAFDGNATIDIALKVTDASNPENFAISMSTVQVNNIAPVGTINLPEIAREGQQVTIGSTVLDNTNDTHTYLWTVSQGSNVMTGTGPAFTFTPEDNGQWSVALRVRDDDGGVHNVIPQTLTVANVDPTASITASEDEVEEGTEVEFTASADDVDADPLVYSWVVVRDGEQVGSGNGTNFAFTPDDNGTYDVGVTVTDGDGGSVSTQKQIEVTNAVATAQVTSGDTLGVRGATRTVQLAANDPGAADVEAGFTYTVNWGDGSAIETYAPGTTSASHVYTANGSYTASVTATDKDNDTSTAATITMVTQTAILSGGVLTVGGAGTTDTFNISRSGNNVSVSNGAEGSQSFNGATRVVIHAGPGNDLVNLNNMNIPVAIYGGDGNDVVNAGNSSARVEVYGGAGNDIINGGNGGDIMVGGDGIDIVTSGNGRDLIIGGRGNDIFNGGNDEDILVGGYSAHDNDSAALNRILNEWQSNRSYNQRVNNIRGPVTNGVNGSSFLRPNVSVWDDAAVDVISGGNGRDWFIVNTTNNGSQDLITGNGSNETVNDINP